MPSSRSQTREESISDYMLRARMLVIKEHPTLAHFDKEHIFVTSVLLGLYDRQLAASLAVARIQNAADAERLAVKGKAVPHDQQSRRSNLNLLHEVACRLPGRLPRCRPGSFWWRGKTNWKQLSAASVQLVVQTLNQANYVKEEGDYNREVLWLLPIRAFQVRLPQTLKLTWNTLRNSPLAGMSSV